MTRTKCPTLKRLFPQALKDLIYCSRLKYKFKCHWNGKFLNRLE